MKYIKLKDSFQLDASLQMFDLTESLSLVFDDLIKSFEGEETDIYVTEEKDLDTLTDTEDFNKFLKKNKLRKSDVLNTYDYQTFLSSPIKFILLHKAEENDLYNPVYIVIQKYLDDKSEWGRIRIYKVKSDISNFYNKLSSKTVELIDGEENYIYKTADSKTYELQNLNKENDIFKRFYLRDELKHLIVTKKLKINIL